MSHPAQDRPAPDRPAPDRPAQDLPAQDLPAGAGPVPAALAPYALVRSTVLARSAQPAETATVRAALDELRRIEAESEQLRAALGDDLYASRDGHGEEFHRRVVLPLRRDLHNGRPPRPLPPDRLGDLPERLPRLARWLRLGDRRTELLAALATGVPPALAAERAALAAICRDPAFARAVATTSADLLRAVTANGHHPDGAGARSGRRRKEEATVLRHALRATCKTSPLSWFTAVGWVSGEPAPDDAGGPADGPAGATLRELPGAAAQPGDVHRAPISVVRVNRALVGALVVALLDRPRRRLSLPHAMTSAAVIDGGQARYARTRTVFAGGRYLVGREEQLDLAARPELALVASLVEYPELPGPLGTRLAAALGRPVGDPGVQRFLGQLLDAELLVPVEPVHPQHPEPLAALAVWLEQWPQDAELIRRIRRIDAATKAFAATPAADRPRALAELAGDWRHLLADAGRPVPADAAPLTVLSEDVHETPSSGAARFGGSGDRPGGDGAAPVAVPGGLGEENGRSVASGDVTSLAVPGAGVPASEWSGVGGLVAGVGAVPRAGLGGVGGSVALGDAASSARPGAGVQGSVSAGGAEVGRVLGVGDREVLAELGAVAELFDHGHLMRRAARDRFVARYGVGGVCGAPWEFGADVAAAWSEVRVPAELAALRAEFTALAEVDGELALPAGAVRALAGRLPGWTAARPLSYAWFVQRDPADGLLCVNHIYGGWGRFTSRFLDAAPPGAAAEVARQLRAGLGPGARAAQIRPVGGFNANLHPLLLAEEIGPDRHRTALAEADLELVHDRRTDQLRLRIRSTGEPLDVLYLGFLAPIMLPQRLAPLLDDHPNGAVDLRSWLPRTALTAPGGTVLRTPRLRHRQVVLTRRRWHLPPPVLAALRSELAEEARELTVPLAAVARWRSRLGLPEQLFLHPAAEPVTDRTPAEAFAAHLRAPKPQPVDLGNPLHLLHLDRWLARHPGGAVLEEALPAIGGGSGPERTVELVVESYRPARGPATDGESETAPARTGLRNAGGER